MALNPITHDDGTGYDMMIPEVIEVEDGPMVELNFTDSDGNTLSLSLFDRQVKELIKLLAEVL